MSAITFDTIEYFDELVNAGFSEKQAKAQTKALKQAVSSALDGELVTKSDLKTLELGLEKRFSDIEKRFVRLEVLMTLMLAILLIPTLKDLLA